MPKHQEYNQTTRKWQPGGHHVDSGPVDTQMSLALGVIWEEWEEEAIWRLKINTDCYALAK